MPTYELWDTETLNRVGSFDSSSLGGRLELATVLHEAEDAGADYLDALELVQRNESGRRVSVASGAGLRDFRRSLGAAHSVTNLSVRRWRRKTIKFQFADRQPRRRSPAFLGGAPSLTASLGWSVRTEPQAVFA